MTDDFRDTSSGIIWLMTRTMPYPEKKSEEFEIKLDFEDLYGDLEWIPESKRKPYRETGEQICDVEAVTGATGRRVSQDGL